MEGVAPPQITCKGIPSSTVIQLVPQTIGTVHITVIDARDLRGVDNGTCNNPYTSIRVMNPNMKQLGPKLRTLAESRTVHPKWNATFQLPVCNISDSLLHRVWARHVLSKNILLGEVHLPLSEIKTNKKEQLNLPLEQSLHRKQYKDVQGSLTVEVFFKPTQVTETRHLVLEVGDRFGIVWYQLKYCISDPKLHAGFGCWRAMLDSMILTLGYEKLNHLCHYFQAEQHPNAINKEFFKKSGVTLEGFQVQLCLLLPPRISQECIERMKKYWLIECFDQTSQLQKMQCCNAFDFYLDSLATHPTLYSMTRASVLMSSTELCTTSSNETVIVSTAPSKSTSTSKTFRELLGYVDTDLLL